MKGHQALLCATCWTFAVLPTAIQAQPTTHRVPADFASIQEAIGASQNGDTVLVSPGWYIENLDLAGKAIRVASTDGPASTTIDGAQQGSVVKFVSNEGLDTVLEGFTITNGSGTALPPSRESSIGGGIYCSYSSPTIRNNVIIGNYAYGAYHGMCCEFEEDGGQGGGIGLEASAAVVEGNAILQNTVTEGWDFFYGLLEPRGGGVYGYGFSGRMSDNLIQANQAYLNGFGAGLCLIACNGSCENNVIDSNGTPNRAHLGGGIYSNVSPDLRVQNNRITNNLGVFGAGIAARNAAFVGNLIAGNGDLATLGGGGASVYHFGGAVFELNTIVANVAATAPGIQALATTPPDIRNCILWNPAQGPEIEGAANISYSLVRGGYPGTGNISDDPLLTDWSAGDYSLSQASPCIDAGDPAVVLCEADLDGNSRLLDGNLDRTMVIDMGAHEFSHARLEILGAPQVGQAISINVNGTTGMSTFLLVGLAPGPALFSHFGCLFLDLGSPFSILGVGSIPVSLAGSIPGPAAGATLVLQALALGGGSGNLTNAVELAIE